jgi:hypothetical protein
MQIYFFVPNYIYFSILIVFVSIIFHLKSSLAKNYLMSSLLHTIFNLLLNCVLLFPQQCTWLSTSYHYYYEPGVPCSSWVQFS